VCTETAKLTNISQFWHNLGGGSLRRSRRTRIVSSVYTVHASRANDESLGGDGEASRERRDALAAKLTDVSVAFAVSVVAVEAASAVAHPTYNSCWICRDTGQNVNPLRELIDINAVFWDEKYRFACLRYMGCSDNWVQLTSIHYEWTHRVGKARETRTAVRTIRSNGHQGGCDFSSPF